MPQPELRQPELHSEGSFHGAGAEDSNAIGRFRVVVRSVPHKAETDVVDDVPAFTETIRRSRRDDDSFAHVAGGETAVLNLPHPLPSKHPRQWHLQNLRNGVPKVPSSKTRNSCPRERPPGGGGYTHGSDFDPRVGV